MFVIDSMQSALQTGTVMSTESLTGSAMQTANQCYPGYVCPFGIGLESEIGLARAIAMG